MPTPKEDYLAVLMKKQEVMNKMLSGAAMVAEGGVEGVRLAAEEQPELILNVIDMLVTCLQSSWKEHLALIEDHFSLMDDILNLP